MDVWLVTADTARGWPGTPPGAKMHRTPLHIADGGNLQHHCVSLPSPSQADLQASVSHLHGLTGSCRPTEPWDHPACSIPTLVSAWLLYADPLDGRGRESAVLQQMSGTAPRRREGGQE